MSLTFIQICELVAYGAGMEISARKYTFAQIKELAAYAGASDRKPLLKINDVSGLTHQQMKEIAAHGSGCVFFVF